MELVIVPRVRTPATTPNVDPRPQPLTLEARVRTQRPALLPTPQRAFIPEPVAVNTSLPAGPVGPIHAVVPVTQAPPLMVPVLVRPPEQTVLPAVPPSWHTQRADIGPSPYSPAQPIAPPPPHIAHVPVVIDHHQPGLDQYMDITDDDGYSRMGPCDFGEAATPREPVPAPLVQTLVSPAEGTPQCAYRTELVRWPAVAVACAPTFTAGPTRGFLNLDAGRLRKKVRASRLPYGPHPSVTPLAPSQNRWVVRLRRSVHPRRKGPTDTHRSARDNSIARASRLQKRSLLCKKFPARPQKPQYLENPTPPRVDDQPKAANPTASVDSPSAQKKGRTYFDRLHETRASPFSQRGPSEVSILACKVVPKSVSPRKAFILQRHLTARDRRATGTDGRTGFAYQTHPSAGQQTDHGPQQRPAPSQRKAPVGDHVYPRRKRQTAADFIRAEDAEKEKETLDAAADALQSMGLNSEAFVPASSSSVSVSDAPVSSSMALPSSVMQGPEFNQDQAQLLLEDIFEDLVEDCAKKQSGLVDSFPSSSPSSGSSSDPGSESDDD